MFHNLNVMTPSFTSHYVAAYDLLNEDKPYRDEVAFLLKLYESHTRDGAHPESVLDLGCGSGEHLRMFSSGTRKTGVEISFSMLQVAKNKNIPNITYSNTSISNFRSEEKFDLVYSLFHVLSYQTTDADLLQTLAAINASLTATGLAVFDFWHRTAWDDDPPVKRKTIRENSTMRVERTSTPVFERETGLVSIDMDILIFRNGADQSRYEQFSERHEMRAYTLRELMSAAEITRMEVVGSGPWMISERPLESSDWYGWVALKKCVEPEPDDSYQNCSRNA